MWCGVAWNSADDMRDPMRVCSSQVYKRLRMVQYMFGTWKKVNLVKHQWAYRILYLLQRSPWMKSQLVDAGHMPHGIDLPALPAYGTAHPLDDLDRIWTPPLPISERHCKPPASTTLPGKSVVSTAWRRIKIDDLAPNFSPCIRFGVGP